MPEVRYLRTMVDGVPVVTAPAEIDITTAEQLRTVLLHSAAREHATIVVDMTRTRFCDLAGLAVLVQGHKRAAARGGELRLVLAAGSAVSHIMNLTCLDRLIPCFPGLAGALARTPAATRAARSTSGLDTRDPRTVPGDLYHTWTKN